MSATTHSQPRAAFARWRVAVAGPLVALGILLWAILATDSGGVVVRAPAHVGGRFFLLAGPGVALLFVGAVVLRPARRTGRFPPPRAAVSAVRRERWTP